MEKLPPQRASTLLHATRSHPLYVQRFIQGLTGKTEEVFSREEWEGEKLHVLAMDCEMIETKDDDMALARVSVVELTDSWSSQPKQVIDDLVMPCSSVDFIVDVRPHITGLDMYKLQDKGISIEQARDKFKSLVRPHTIVVGHAVDHDLLALGIRLERVIDTALLFTVEGAEQERTHSLAYLSGALLGDQAVERSERGGLHDSVEDASLALGIVMRLMCDKKYRKLEFPVALPREESGAKRKLQAALEENFFQAKVLRGKIAVSQGNLQAKLRDLARGDKTS